MERHILNFTSGVILFYFRILLCIDFAVIAYISYENVASLLLSDDSITFSYVLFGVNEGLSMKDISLKHLILMDITNV